MLRLKTLLVSGTSKDRVSNTRPIVGNLRKSNLDVRWEWNVFPSQETDRHLIPADCDFVLLLVDFMGHGQVSNIYEQAKKRNLLVVKTSHRWAMISQELTTRKIIDSEQPEIIPPEIKPEPIVERIEMAATPEKTPEAIVIGGRLEDRAEIMSRMLHYGWKVKDHWLSGEGGHEYNKSRNGIKLVVVLRDVIENKQYQQACTLADLSRVPIIKWDINRELFRKRMEQQDLIYAPVTVTPPAPEVIPLVKLEETIQEIKNGLLEEVAEKPIYKSVTATSSLDSLVAASKLVIEELNTNPLFRGVTIRIKDDYSVEILPIARPYTITGGMAKLANAPDLKSDAERHEGSSPSAPTPPPPPIFKRPVEQPIVPKYEHPIRPTIIKKGRGKDHLKGQKLNMACRYPGCRGRSRGPRFGFMCQAHENIPTKQKKEYQKVFNKTHVNP